MQTELSENWYETTEDVVMAHEQVCSLRFVFLWVKFLKINKEKNLLEYEGKKKKKENNYSLWDFETCQTSNSLQPWATTAQHQAAT